MEMVVCGVPFGTPREREALERVKDAGFTSVQIYTFWRDFEPERGRFDWSRYDRDVELIRAAGLKYVPFILMGPKYAAPDWWLADPRHQGLVCLEHGKASPVESVWNPAFRAEVSRVLEAFAAHYMPQGVLESVQPGISGDYGEAIFPVLGNWPGDYHTHRGYWCGGEDAARSFRDWLRARYPTVRELNARWRSSYADLDQVRPFPRHRASSRTSLFDMTSWYRESMTAYAEFWMAECRRCFPGIPVYLCTGGSEEPEHGSLFAEQARVAARHGGGIRLTNEGNKFYENFRNTAHMAAACRLYGAYLGLEPVGPMTERGVRARCFGSLAYGTRQIFHYFGNVFDGGLRPRPGALAALGEYRRFFGTRPRGAPLAVFWPEDAAAVEGGMSPAVGELVELLRRMYTLEPVSESMILDGALRGARVFVALGARSTRREALAALARHVREDGLTILADGRLLDLELEPVRELDEVFGILPDSEEAWGHARQEVRPLPGFPRLSACGSFDSEVAWLGLAPGTEMLSAARPRAGQSGTTIREVSAIFRRVFPGGGQGILYSGRVNLRRDPEAIFADPGVYMALLADVCEGSGLELVEPQEGELSRAPVQGGFLVLKEDRIEFAPAPDGRS